MTAEAKQTAMLPVKRIENARNMSPERETIATMRYVTYDASEGHEAYRFETPVEARFYRGRTPGSSVVYCSLWVRSKAGTVCSGRGRAGGGGYHKESAALQAAAASAGIALTVPFDGAGEAAMHEALRAIAVAAGYGDLPGTIL